MSNVVISRNKFYRVEAWHAGRWDTVWDYDYEEDAREAVRLERRDADVRFRVLEVEQTEVLLNTVLDTLLDAADE